MRPQPTSSYVTSEPTAKEPRQFVTWTFYKVDPAWRRLPDDERARGKAEFAEVCERYAGDGVIVRSYTTVGLKAGVDLMLWRISYELEKIQQMESALRATGVGQYLDVSHNLLAMTKRSLYVDKLNPEHEAARLYVQPGRNKYLFVYPFLKTRDWYLLGQNTRQGLMDTHITIGNKYKSVKLNTTYSFGLDDQEFVVAFESDSPGDFLDLVMELRGTDSSKYTLRDTPIFTCMALPIGEALSALGG